MKLDGRAYTDPASFYDSTGSKHEFQRYLEKGSPETDYDNLSLKNVGVFVDDLGRRIGHLLCCREVKGFVFHTRNWGIIAIPSLILKAALANCIGSQKHSISDTVNPSNPTRIPSLGSSCLLTES